MNLWSTGKYLSKALILASTNPQYDKRLFIELQIQYMKIASSEHVVYINCSECQNNNKKPICHTVHFGHYIWFYVGRLFTKQKGCHFYRHARSMHKIVMCRADFA